jgi:hypothetical protein
MAKPLNGRRLLKVQLQRRYRWIVIDPNNMARFAPMAPRHERRARARELDIPFRPVYGYAGK